MLKRTKKISVIILTAFAGLLTAAGLSFAGGAEAYAAEGEMVHAVCGKSDCAHSGHEAITYLPWTEENSLPSYGNYYLTRDYSNVVMRVQELPPPEARPETPDEGETTDPTTPDEGTGEGTTPTTPTEGTGEGTTPTTPDEGTGETTDPSTPTEEIDDTYLNLDLNGHTIESATTSPAIEVCTRLNLCDSSANKTGRIVNTSTVTTGTGTGCAALRVSDFGTLNLYGGAVEGKFAAIHNNGRGTINLYDGTVTGSVNGLVSGGGTVNIAQDEGASLTISGQVGVSATVGTVNISKGTVTGTARGLETDGTAAATITGGTVTGGEYDLYSASTGIMKVDGTPLFSQAPKFFVAHNSGDNTHCYLNLISYTFTDGSADKEITLYTDVANIAANTYLVRCNEAQSAKLICGNEEMLLTYEANALKIVPIVAYVGTTQYYTLTEAFTAASQPENAGCTVKLVSNIALTDTAVLSSAFTIDLNGHSVTAAIEPVISAVSGADITITDNAGGGTLLNRAGEAVKVDGGRVTLSSTVSLSGVYVCASAANAENVGLRLVNFTTAGDDKLKIKLSAACNAEEYFLSCDADYSEAIEFAVEGGEGVTYFLVYSEADGAIKLHAHEFDSQFTVDVPVTCTEAGSKSKHCSGCDAKIEETTIEPLGHGWQSASCTQPRNCPACGLTQGEALGHEWKAATCTEAKHCPVCDTTEGEALGHKFGNWTVKTQPTEESEGEAEHTCSRCRVKFSEALPALTSESYTKTEVAATINANAYTSYTLEIGGKTVTVKVVKEGTKLTPAQTETGEEGGGERKKTATIVAVVCVAVFAVAVTAVVLYVYGVFDKKRRR